MPADDLDAILRTAVELKTPRQREVYLKAACEGNSDLLARAQQLLALRLESLAQRSSKTSEDDATAVPNDPVSNPQRPAAVSGSAATQHSSPADLAASAAQTTLRYDSTESRGQIKRQDAQLPATVVGVETILSGSEDVRPNPPSDLPIEVSNRYRLEGEIARGGMGAIIKGRDTKLGRELVVKVLLDAHRQSSDVVRRFVEEAQISGQLQHPGIAPVYELGRFADGRPYFSMKLVKGETLAAMLAARAEVTEDRARFLGIFLQVSETVAYAHSRAVLHRDLKPNNIMVGAFGEVQVMDWGLAKVMSDAGASDHSAIRTSGRLQESAGEGDVTHTRLGSVIGTPAYMSPEQANGAVDRLDERTDVFALGAILCEVLCGHPPYVGSDSREVQQLASRGSLDDCFSKLEQLNADTELVQLCQECLQPEPSRRPADAAAVARRMSAYMHSVEQRARRAELSQVEQKARAQEAMRTAEEAEAKVAAERRTRIWQLGLAAAVLLFTLGLTGVANHFLRQQKAQTMLVAETLQSKSDYLYVAHLQMAQQAWERGLIGRMRELLDAHIPTDGQRDLRTFEWQYLNGLASTVERFPAMPYGDIITTTAIPLDGEYVAVGGNDARVRLFDLSTYQLTQELVGHEQKLLNILVSPDGDVIVTCDAAQIRLWRRDGRIFREAFVSDGIAPSKTRLSPDGEFLLLARSDATADVLDLTQPNPTPISIPVSRPLVETAWMHQGHHLLLVDANGRITRCNAESPDREQLVLEAEPGVMTVGVSRDNRHMAVVSLKQVSFYQLDDAFECELVVQRELDAKQYVYTLGFDETLVIVSESATTLWDVETGQQKAKITNTNGAAFYGSPHDPLLASVAQDNMIRIWDVETGKLKNTIRGHRNEVYSASFDPAGRIVSGGRDQMVRIAQLDLSPAAIELAGHTDWIWSICYAPSGDRLASAGRDGQILIWNLQTMQQQLRIKIDSSVQCVDFSPDGSQLISSSADGMLRCWDASTGEPLLQWQAHQTEVNSVAYSEDGQFVVSAGNDGHVAVWETKSGEQVARTSIDGYVWGLDFCGDGTITFGGTGRLAYTWHYEANLPPRPIFTSSSNITSLQFSSDDAQLACTMSDGTIALLDYFPGGEDETILRTHSADAMCTDFSEDGKSMCSCGADGKIQFWYLRNDEPTIRIELPNVHLQNIRIAPDSRSLATGGWDNLVRVWPIH